MENFNNKIKTIIAKRNDDNKYYYVMVWEEEIKLILSDMAAAINFIKNECTDEELYWMSEVFDDIYEKSKNDEFIKVVQERVKTVQNEEWKKSIEYEIKWTLGE